MIADQLGVLARTPGELTAALADDPRHTVIVVADLESAASAQFLRSLAALSHLRLIVEARTASAAHAVLVDGCAEMDLDDARWRDRERYEEWDASRPAMAETQAAVGEAAPAVDLADPVTVCAADPYAVSAAYEAEAGDGYGGLRAGWMRAGQSLCRDQPVASRALVLLAALGEGADPRLGPTLASLTETGPWRLDWARVKGDVTPPWPGPVGAVALGRGPLEDCVLASDHLGTIRAVRVADASARGRLAGPAVDVDHLTVLTDGTILLLDSVGRVHVDERWAASTRSGIQALLDDGPVEKQNLLDSLAEQRGTALASAGKDGTHTVVLGDEFGWVRVFGDVPAATALHEGRVTAVAALCLPVDGGQSPPLLYSGGTDGKVRLWSPGREPLTAPVTQRPCPVVALDAAWTAEGVVLAVAWGDGLTEWHRPDNNEQLRFRPGVSVRAVTVALDGSLVVGMDEAVVRLSARS
ncbi:WD40 repeat domain-containing protein [Streptomyces arboris]|uniref:WD40 repeat domain-containing protein n=1 Tax=Streptomyces arboris TaxID=2600619 RepID=UPI003BF52F60